MVAVPFVVADPNPLPRASEARSNCASPATWAKTVLVLARLDVQSTNRLASNSSRVRCVMEMFLKLWPETVTNQPLVPVSVIEYSPFSDAAGVQAPVPSWNATQSGRTCAGHAE